MSKASYKIKYLYLAKSNSLPKKISKLLYSKKKWQLISGHVLKIPTYPYFQQSRTYSLKQLLQNKCWQINE
jgi:hypothetical protein